MRPSSQIGVSVFNRRSVSNIYFGDIRDDKDIANAKGSSLPQELRCLEEIFGIQGLTRQQQYAMLTERLKDKKAKTNELPDWVRSRRQKIEQFKTELPLVHAYLESLIDRRPRT